MNVEAGEAFDAFLLTRKRIGLDMSLSFKTSVLTFSSRELLNHLLILLISSLKGIILIQSFHACT